MPGSEACDWCRREFCCLLDASCNAADKFHDAVCCCLLNWVCVSVVIQPLVLLSSELGL